MNSKILWLTVAAVVLSFAGGFLLANALNRNELAGLRAENERLKNAPPGEQSSPQSTLSTDEIRKRIEEADQNPQNFTFQRNLGLALYKYASMKQDTELLKDSARILLRAHGLKPEDHEITVGLGNAYFDIGYFSKDNPSLEKAREYYQKALGQKPKDADIITDVGLTYFLQDPPDYSTALQNFYRSLEIDPKHEKTLQFTIQALVKENKPKEAERYLAALKSSNPDNQAIGELTAQVQSAAGSAQ